MARGVTRPPIPSFSATLGRLGGPALSDFRLCRWLYNISSSSSAEDGDVNITLNVYAASQEF